MSQKINLRVKVEPGSIVRVLVAMGKRGYEPAALTATKKDDVFDLTVVVEDDRPLTQLTRALERQFDVDSVEVVK